MARRCPRKADAANTGVVSAANAKIDWLGGVILVGFLVAQLTRSWVLGHWAEGVALTTLGL